MKTPVIGVLLQQIPSPKPGALIPIQFVNHPYLAAIERAGGLPLCLPLTQSPEKLDTLLDACDGFLFPGGADVDPRMYGEDPAPQLGSVDRKSDEEWRYVLEYARKSRKPLLGICRGLQVVNAAMGGSLYQDLSMMPTKTVQHRQQAERSYPVHKVSIAPDSRLKAILGTDEVFTNTLHHQCVNRCADGLRVAARTSDGAVEAMEDEEGLIQLVQWHPEELQETVPCMRNLFSDLIQRAQHRL